MPHNPVGHVVADHPQLVKFGRIGWFAKGIVYIVAGVLTLIIAAKASGWSKAATAPNQEASPTGALKSVAHGPAGAWLLWLLAIGMFIYAAWRIVSALLPGSTDAHGWAKRIGYAVSAVIYTTLAFTAIAIARSSVKAASDNGNTKVTTMSGRLMAHTGGRVLVGAVGVIVIGVGVYRIMKALKVDVDDELDLSSMPAERRVWTERLGAIGEFGRGIGIGLIGFFMLRAAITYDANQATGLDGALRRLATQKWGLVVVFVVGLGFAAYGMFCVATFPRRRLQAP